MSVEFTARFKQILLASGWTLDRCIDLSNEIEELAKEGFEIFPLAQRYLENLECIDLINGKIEFGSGFGLGMFDSWSFWSKKNSIDLYILGFYTISSSEIYIGSNGKFYFADRGAVYQVADNVSEGLDILCFQNKPNMVLIPPTWKDKTAFIEGVQ